MAKLIKYLACLLLVSSILVEGSPTNPLNGVRIKRSLVKPWSSLASCLDASASLNSTAMLNFIKGQTIVVPLITKNGPLKKAQQLLGTACLYSYKKFSIDRTRKPYSLAKAVCEPPKCDPASCQPVEYYVPVLKEKCSNTNVWLMDTEKVTVAFRKKD